MNTDTALGRRHRDALRLREIDPARPPGRKTSIRRSPPLPGHLRPDWKVWFTAPGIIGETIRFTGKNKDYVLAVVGAFLRKTSWHRGSVEACIARAGSPDVLVRKIEYGPDGVFLVEGCGMRKI